MQTLRFTLGKCATITGLCLLAGCSSASQDFAEGGEGGDTETLSSELSSNEQCNTANANKTTTGNVGTWTIGNSYGSSACYAGYLIDANAYESSTDAGEPIPSIETYYHYFTDGDSLPTTKSECEKLRLGVYIWYKNSGYIGNRWSWGSWSNGVCQRPHVFPFSLVGRHVADYRIAVSARRYSVAKDSSSSYVLRSIRSKWNY